MTHIFLKKKLLLSKSSVCTSRQTYAQLKNCSQTKKDFKVTLIWCEPGHDGVLEWQTEPEITPACTSLMREYFS